MADSLFFYGKLKDNFNIYSGLETNKYRHENLLNRLKSVVNFYLKRDFSDCRFYPPITYKLRYNHYF